MTEDSPIDLTDDDYHYVITIDPDDEMDDSDVIILSDDSDNELSDSDVIILSDDSDNELNDSDVIIIWDTNNSDDDIQILEMSFADGGPPQLDLDPSISDHNVSRNLSQCPSNCSSHIVTNEPAVSDNFEQLDHPDMDVDDIEILSKMSTLNCRSDPLETEEPMDTQNSCLNDQITASYINQTGGGSADNDWQNYCYIKPTHVEVTKSGRITQVDATRLEFKGLGKDKESDLIRIPQLLDNFLRKTIIDNGGSLADTLFCVQISHAESTHTAPIFMNFRKYPQTDGTAVFNMMGKINQSNANLAYNDMNITIILYDIADKSIPVYEGGVGNSIYFDVHKGIKRRVSNTDTMCLARAIILGKAKADRNAARTKEEEVLMAKRIRRLIRKDVISTWKNASKKLLKDAGLPTNLSVYGSQHIPAIARIIPEYRIQLYTRQLGQEYYTLAFPTAWNPTGTKFITIAHHDNHFDFIQPGRDTMNKFFCDRCGKDYKRISVHRCEFKCSTCHKYDCQKLDDLTLKMIRCTKCNVVFKTQLCYDNHKIITGLKSTCDRYQLCVHCGKYLCNDNYRIKKHECDKDIYCEYCGWTTRGHSCCWKTPDDKEKARCLKKQAEFKLIFFDIESVVVETTETDPVQYANSQWANLIVCQMVCHICHDGGTGDCQCIQEFHFAYQDGDGPNSVVDRCVNFWLTDPRCANAIIFSHNGSRFDHHFVLASLIRREIAPQLLQNGTQLIQMTVKPMKHQKINHLTFKDSYLLTPLPLAMLPEAFDIPSIAKGEFPFLFNHPENYGKVLPELPPERFFMVDSKKPKARSEFLAWYQDNKLAQFNFDEELLNYCKMDVEILRRALCKYMVMSTEIAGWNPLVHCATYASFSMFQLRNNHAKPDQIAILPVNGFKANERQSVIAIKMLLYLESTGKTIKHKLNGGEHKIEIAGHEYWMDGYDASTKTVYEILGCLWHGCPKCFKPDAFAPGGKRRFGQLYGVTQFRLNALRTAGYNVVEYWEHEINSALTEDVEMRKFFDTCQVTGRLVPRDAFMGGRTQTYKLKATAEGNRMIDYVDFNSLYPATTSYFAEYPIGSPTVITEGFKQFKTGEPSPYRGLIKCDILTPQDIQFPVVGCRLNGKLLFPICYSCAKRGTNTDCTHPLEEERMIHTTLCDVELSHALIRGYKVKKVYEVWEFSNWERGGLFKPFNDKYTQVKMEASGWPSHLQTEEQKTAWLDSVFDHTGIRLNPLKMKKNPGARTIAKLSLNSSWGKLGERCDKTNIEYVPTNTDRLGEIMNNPAVTVTGALLIEHFLIVSSKPSKDYRKPVRFSNVVYAAITTATARLKLLEAMEKIGDDLIYTDTDSLMYYRYKDREDPLKNMRGEWIGMLACEVPFGHRIQRFVSPAAKVYSIEMIDEKDEIYHTTKAKGVTIDYDAAQIVGFEGLSRLVDSLIDEDGPDGLLTIRAMITRKLGVIGTRIQTKKLTAVMDKVLYYPDFTTRPYGYRLVSIMSSHHAAASVDQLSQPPEDRLPINAIRPATVEWITYCLEHKLTLNGKSTSSPPNKKKKIVHNHLHK